MNNNETLTELDIIIRAQSERIAELEAALSCAVNWYGVIEDTELTRSAIGSMRRIARKALRTDKKRPPRADNGSLGSNEALESVAAPTAGPSDAPTPRTDAVHRDAGPAAQSMSGYHNMGLLARQLEREAADLRHDIASYVQHNAELATENADLRGDHPEWLCKQCKIIHTHQCSGVLQPCPDCGSAMTPTSVNMRTIAELRGKLDEANEYRNKLATLLGGNLSDWPFIYGQVRATLDLLAKSRSDLDDLRELLEVRDAALAEERAAKEAAESALKELEDIYPNFRQLIDGFMTDPHWNKDWDEQTRNELIAWRNKHNQTIEIIRRKP